MFQLYSLRIKFIAIFLLLIASFGSLFYFLWLPNHYESENIRYSNETEIKFDLLKLTVEQFYYNHKKYDNSKGSLFDKVITEQMALYNDWVSIIIYDTKGDKYFQIKKENNEKIKTYKSKIFSLKEKVGTLELIVAPEIFIQTKRKQMKELSYTFFVLLLLLLCAILLIQEYIIQKPLTLLNSATKAIIVGDFDHKLPSVNRDEIGELTDSFGKMKSSLNETQEKLQEEILLAKDIAQAFSNSEEQIRTIIENIADGMVIVDEKCCIELYNPAFHLMLGYQNYELSGKNISSLLITKQSKSLDTYISQFLSGESTKFINQGIHEIFALTKEGHEIPIEITIKDYLINKTHYFVAMIRDISDRKEADRKIKSERDKAQLYLDTAQVAIFSLNRSGSIVLANQKSLEIFCYTESELQCKNWFDLINEKETKETLEKQYFLNMKQQYEIPEYLILKMANKENEERIIEWHTKVLNSKEGKPTGIIMSGIDITKNHYAEIEKNELRKQLIQSQKMEAIGQLTGGIAHDFNNILAGMMGYTEMLLERENTNPDKRKIEYLNLIYESGERATDLIQKMLSYSRGINVVKKQSLYLPGMVKDVMKMLTAVIPSSVEIEMAFEENVPNIGCDSLSIQQVIMNLCINARDAMNNKGVISLKIKNSNHQDSVCSSCGMSFKGHYVSLSVNDIGSGINKENLLRLFEPFFSTKDVGKGSGMGLSVIHGILHEMDAHIVVDTKIGTGTSFIVYFPLADKKEPDTINKQVA